MQPTEFFERIRMSGDPLAHPESIVVRGNARFTVLTERLLRLEWSPSGEFTDFATFAFPNRRIESPPRFSVRQDGEQVSIETHYLTLTYRVGSGAFSSENLAITYRVGETQRTWHPGQVDTENLGGTRRTLDMTGGEVPLEPGLVSRAGWALYDDSAAFALRAEDGWVSARPLEPRLDWYFFGYGHAYPDAFADYTRFGGQTPLIPRYVLGVWWSRFWPYSDTDLERLVDEFAAHQIPLDVLVVDMDWHLPDHWTGYTWNSKLFPDPQTFLAAMHARGLRVTLNLHPADGIGSHEAAYAAFVQALGLPADESPIPFRIADQRFAELYFTLLHHPLEEQGVDFWWIDWQQGESTEISGLDPLPWLNHLHFTDIRRRGQRPLLFSRWGGLGNHRYPIGFSGDTFGGWPTLAALPHFTATAANVGFGWWSHDIGGHFGAADGELLTRWVQFGALSPCLRLHAVKHPLADRRPWAFPQPAFDAMRAAFELRYRLVPYLYTMAERSHEQGTPLIRPMYYAFPEEESAYLARRQYHLGDRLLAAPATTPINPETGTATQDVWIPPGAWYRFETGAVFVGPRWVRLEARLETIPLFATAGAIVPLGRPALHLRDMPRDWLEIRVFAGQDGAFTFYEDDGETEAYLRGAYERTSVTYADEGNGRHRLRIGPVTGHAPGLPDTRAYEVTVVGVDAPEGAMADDGTPLAWTHDAQTRTMRVTVPARRKDEPFEMVIQAATRAAVAIAATEPFASVVAYTARDEARRQLAQALLVPPYGADGQPQPCSVEAHWRETSELHTTEVSLAVPQLTAETMLAAPFALGDSRQPRRWELEARFASGDEQVVSVVRGPYINPPIQRWQVRSAGDPEAQTLQADLAARATITEPFDAYLDLAAGATAEATATIAISEPMTISIDAWTTGGLELAIDGEPVREHVPQATIAGLGRPWPAERFGPVALTAGRHTITLRLTAPERAPWVFGALLLDDAGEPLVNCMQVSAEEDDVAFYQ